MKRESGRVVRYASADFTDLVRRARQYAKREAPFLRAAGWPGVYNHITELCAAVEWLSARVEEVEK